ncbi:unnamed protein product [Caenorhabditis bovis]|uniref:Transthyretin-like family protein n=1 Tax=Caenorhabditis bovis TaxID=2654633 RepID=A0A8S1F7R9_9PELO|nr:unnamed protein product [Caenorhabditis bovis]
MDSGKKNDTKTMMTFGNTQGLEGLQNVQSIIGRKQSVGVRGKLLCGNQPISNATVKLWDNDLFDPDDLMAEAQTKPDGSFQVAGLTVSTTSIDPQIRIYHNCRNKKSGCKRRVTFNIPDNYISSGNQVTKWFEFGALNMEIGVKYKEDHQCF